MSESYAEFQEADGSVRMAGQLAYPQATPSDVLTVQDDGTIAAAAGGGSVPVGSEQGSGNAVSVANNDQTPLTWDTSFGPDTLLDISTPDTPSVLEAGVYAVAVTVQPQDGITVGGYYQAILDLDLDGEDVELFQDSPPSTAVNPAPQITIGNTWYIPAGGTIQLAAENVDGASAVHYLIRSWSVTRISGPQT